MRYATARPSSPRSRSAPGDAAVRRTPGAVPSAPPRPQALTPLPPLLLLPRGGPRSGPLPLGPPFVIVAIVRRIEAPPPSGRRRGAAGLPQHFGGACAEGDPEGQVRGR